MTQQIDRINHAEQKLLALGDDIGEFHDFIHPQTGDLILALPDHFLHQAVCHDGPDTYTMSGIWLGNMEGSTADQHALLEFLARAPQHQRWLLDELKQAVATLPHNPAMRLMGSAYVANEGIKRALDEYFDPAKGR
jgi:hypothetical protein